MSRLAHRSCAHPTHPLLGDLNGEEALSGDLQIEPAAFSDGELGSNQLRMVLAQPE